MKFFNRRPEKSQEVPVYQVESASTQLRIMRTHLAAMAGEVSNLRTMLQVGFTDVRSDLEKLSTTVESVGLSVQAEVVRSATLAVDKLRHPSNGGRGAGE